MADVNPSMRIFYVAGATDDAELSGEKPHMTVVIQGLRNADVSTMIGVLPKSGVLCYDAHGDAKGASFAVQCETVDAARAVVVEGTAKLELPNKTALRGQVDDVGKQFLAATAPVLA